MINGSQEESIKGLAVEAEIKEIIKKVQKLYRLAEKAGSEEEAQNAMLRAREILCKYNLSITDVNNFVEEDCEQTIFVIKKNYVPAHCTILANAMCILFQCHCLHHQNYEQQRNRQGIIFIGVGADAVLAHQTFEFLLKFASRKARERKIDQDARNDYFYGFAHAIIQRALEIKKKITEIPQENALVPLKDGAIKQYLDQHYADRTENSRRVRKRNFSNEMELGIEDGISANLNRQVENQKRKAIN